LVSMHTSAAAKEHESGISEPAERKSAETLLLAEAARIIANTPVEAKQLARFYSVPAGKLDVVMPGVNHRIFHPNQDKLRRPLGEDDLHLVYAGRMQPLKGAHPLLEAMGIARREAPEDRKSTRLNSSHVKSSYAVFCWIKKRLGAARIRCALRIRGALSVAGRGRSSPGLRGPPSATLLPYTTLFRSPEPGQAAPAAG